MTAKRDRRRKKRRAHSQTSAAKQRTPGQRQARLELDDLANRHPLVLSATDLHAGKGQFCARVRIDTSAFHRIIGGYPIADDHEDVDLWFGDDYPNAPPAALVTHDRFLNQPHVLLGRLLCIYLDPNREWHPALGVDGAIDRLIEFLRDGAENRFDTRTALFHPIGGLSPSPRIAGTLVVRPSSPAPPRALLGRATVNLRAPHRSDLIRWSTPTRDDTPSATVALVLRTTKAMTTGLVNVGTFGDLLFRVESAGGPSARNALTAAARLVPRLGPEPLRIVVEVPHPADPQISYLAHAVAGVVIPPSTAQHPDVIDGLSDLPIGWTAVSDLRSEVATRRDAQRPTSKYAGKTVEIWGCGGLGSWMAEFIARAGAARILLRDTGAVSGGLLVRQNYLEDDTGLAKAPQLAVRLAAIADDLTVAAATESALDVLTAGYVPNADILIDATINITLAARLDEWARTATPKPLIAQVATDPRTATLALMVISAPAASIGPATIDDATSVTVLKDPTLERFHGFWSPHSTAEQLVPTLGCSTPTFHGSAADLASTAGSLVSLLANHIDVDSNGAHLIEASHARGPAGGGHHFITYSAPD